MIEAILNDTAKIQAEIKETAQNPNDKDALRNLIEERKQARRAGIKEEEKTLSKRIQKELNAIQMARKTAKVTSILNDFRDLKRLKKHLRPLRQQYLLAASRRGAETSNTTE